MKILINEFHAKISHDFTRFVFLGLTKETKDLCQVVEMATSRDGFEAYKAVYYKGEKVTHFYIRFKNSTCAEKAIAFFRASDGMFNAEVVKNILLTWYVLEMTQDRPMTWTTACVDIEGKLDYQLTSNRVGLTLRPFGYSRTIPPRERFPSSVQVMFPTFAEALASTIALGCWLKDGGIVEQNLIYRVKIVGSSKEEWLFTTCGSSPAEAFELDYFVSQAAPVLNDSVPQYRHQAPKREYPRGKNIYRRRNRTAPRSDNVVCDEQNSEQIELKSVDVATLT